MQPIVLPYPPSVNKYWLIGRRGKSGRRMMFLSDAANAFRDRCYLVVRDCDVRLGPAPFAVTVAVWFPDRRERDTDNLWKPIMDGLCHGGAFDSDAQALDSRVIAVGVDRKSPRVEVLLRPLPPDWEPASEWDRLCR